MDAQEPLGEAQARPADSLRLLARDAQDLGVISACLQDARLTLADVVFQPEERRFMAAFTRYRRERQADPFSCDGLTEIASALVLEGVAEAKHRRLPADQPLQLLTIATAPGRDHLLHIDLVFAGDARIQLRADAIDARLTDFGEPAPCEASPCDHEAAAFPGWLQPHAQEA